MSILSSEADYQLATILIPRGWCRTASTEVTHR